MFKKDDYIVITIDTNSRCFIKNYVYKQRSNSSYIQVYRDSELEENGASYLDFKFKAKWRYAFPDEILAYDQANQPIDIKTIKKERKMNKLMLNELEKTYNNLILRRKTVPLFMSNPGLGKTTTIHQFLDNLNESNKTNKNWVPKKMLKITLSQRMPNEVVGMMMPNIKTGKLEVFDSYELNNLNDGDILFIDEVFNGTLKQTLDAFLNLLEDRSLPSGKKMADIMIVAASNPQGLINLTPQIKERFVKIDLKFNSEEYQAYLKQVFAMPENLSSLICTLINKEKFDADQWNYFSPRSIEKALNRIGLELETTYDDLLMPILTKEIEMPMDSIDLNCKKGDKIPYLSLLKLFTKKKNELANNGIKLVEKKTRKKKEEVPQEEIVS